MELFFNYSIDCELPPNTEYTGPERRPFFHGPKDWAFAERSVRTFVERMAALGAGAGASLFVYPDVAMHQKALYREMAAAGAEVALHLNGLRYSRLRGAAAKWLGEMTRAEQREALRQAKADLEDAVGRPCLGYRACYGSASDDTLPLLEELGFTWASNCSGRYRPEFCANWAGSWRYLHRAHARSKLIPGTLRLYEIPVTCGLRTYYPGNPDQPLDLRVESPPSIVGEKRELLRAVIAENVEEMRRRDIAVRTIVAGSHNTTDYADLASHRAQNLEWVVRYGREIAAEHGLAFTPARFVDVAGIARQRDAW